jgi:hypothetical protein
VALIVDPDNLTLNTEVVLTAATKTIKLVRAGNLTADGVTLKCLYSFLKETWKNSSTYIKYPFPMTPITDEQFELKDGWNFDKTGSGSDLTSNLIRTGGWAVKNEAGLTTEMWAGIVTLGSIESGGQVYYQQMSGGAATNFNLANAVNQAVQILRDDDGDGVYSEGSDFDKRSFMKLFLRTQGNAYDDAQLSDIGVTQMSYQVYRFPLSDADDLKITHADIQIDATADGVPDVAPYSGMTITWYATAQQRSIGGTPRNFHVIIDGNGGTAEQIFEYVQFMLRQNADIDAGSGTKNGRVTKALLRFVGDTLYTQGDDDGYGVYIDDFQSVDTNRLVFTDDSAVERTFPYVAMLTLSFGDNLKNDANAVYRVFFTNDEAGDDLGYDYGTANAITVNDNSSSPMAGSVGGNSTIQLTFNYDGNVQRGSASAGDDAPITVVAIGLVTGQFVVATGTIVRSTANSVSLVAALERNYANPT